MGAFDVAIGNAKRQMAQVKRNGGDKLALAQELEHHEKEKE